MVAVDDDEREVALQLVVGLDDGVGQVAVVVALDQVRDGLGVGLGAEAMARGLERLLELAVVLDDPVEDDRQLSVLARRQRMGVALGDRAVRGPACVSETGRRARAVRRRCLLQELKVPDGADVLEPVVFEERDPRGVVAAVLEPLEALDEKRLRCSRPDVSDDAAHPGPPSLVGRVRHPPSKRTRARLANDPFFAVD